MPTLAIAILLGIIQGITEFLPISSTGHLIIVENLVGVSEKTFGLPFDVAVHLGSALALIVFFWQDIKKILTESIKKRYPSPLMLALIIGTIPAGIAGLLLEKTIETNLRSAKQVAINLFVFSGLLLVGDLLSRRKKRAVKQLSIPHAFIVGIFQALAIIPGVSRSGATITGGLIIGYSRNNSARFAFLLSIPIILLAAGKQAVDVLGSGGFTTNQTLIFLVGLGSAAITAFLVVKWFLPFFQKRGFLAFIIYRLFISFLILIL